MYIGRGSKWGNPFKIDEENDREEVVKNYEHHLRSDPDLYNDIINLKGKTLGCYCAPLLCHGDVIRRLGEEILASMQKEDSHGSNLINVLSDAVNKDSLLDCPTPSTGNPSQQEKPGVSTKDTIVNYSTVLDMNSPDSPPIHKSQVFLQVGSVLSSSQCPEIGDIRTPIITDCSRQSTKEANAEECLELPEAAS